MQVNIVKYWDRIRSSFWFVPIIMAVGAVTLAVVTVAFDSRVTDFCGAPWAGRSSMGQQGRAA